MLPSETLLDIFPLFSRFKLDNLKLVSRHICELIDGSAHLFSFRFFYNLKIDGAAYDFSIEIPNVSYRIVENPALEVAPDLSASHRIEEDPEIALQHLRHAFVQRVAISAVPSQTFVRALQDREHTFSVQTLVVGNADLHSMESEELRALIRSIPKLNQLTICDSQLKQDHFSDLLLHDCATRGVTSIVSHQMMDTSPMLTGTGLREFYSVGVRGGQKNEPCFMDLRCRGDYTEHFLLEFLEASSTITMTLNAGALETGKLVETFCLSVDYMPRQRLGKHQRYSCDRIASFIKGRLIIKDLNVEVAWGREMLFISRNHAQAGCSCAYRILKGRYPELSRA